jgi:hypothetical protein
MGPDYRRFHSAQTNQQLPGTASSRDADCLPSVTTPLKTARRTRTPTPTKKPPTSMIAMPFPISLSAHRPPEAMITRPAPIKASPDKPAMRNARTRMGYSTYLGGSRPLRMAMRGRSLLRRPRKGILRRTATSRSGRNTRRNRGDETRRSRRRRQIQWQRCPRQQRSSPGQPEHPDAIRNRVAGQTSAASVLCSRATRAGVAACAFARAALPAAPGR